MKRFTLLLNGKDLDTGRYRYYPYSDRFIKNPHETLSVLSGLNRGNIPDNSDQFIYAKYCIGTDQTNNLAIEAAYKASREFLFFPLTRRNKICSDIFLNLRTHKEKLIDLLIVEGHPRRLAEWELRGMDTGANGDNIKYFSNFLHYFISQNGGVHISCSRKPDGVVCISPPANASASNSFLSILALLAGNTLIIKPPLANPLSTIFLWKEIIHKALIKNNAPKGTVNIVLGNSQIIMNEWLASPYVNDILYFGDSKFGLELGPRIYAAGKKPILELSGNDTLIVWKDADINKAVSSSLDCFLGSTQICMVPKIILVHEKIFNKFRDGLLNAVRQIHVGLPSDPKTILSPVKKIDLFYSFLEDSMSKGAELLCGGKRINHTGTEDEDGKYIQPTLLAINDDTRLDEMLCFNEEIFFPLLPLVKISGTDNKIFKRMVGITNQNRYGLRISLWIRSKEYERKFETHLMNSGLLRINLPHVEFSPYLSTHGGTKRSGGPFGEMNYLWEKTTHLQGISRAIA